MPRGVYIGSIDILDDPERNGVARKVRAQAKALSDHGCTCEIKAFTTPSAFLPKLIHWLPFLPSLEKWPDVHEMASYDYLYLRKPQATKGFIRFLKQVKELNPKITIIEEIPSYPYDDEINSIASRVTIAKDRHYRKQLRCYVDRIADLSGHERIFDIPTIPITNGIDLSSIDPRTPSFSGEGIHILAVAWFQHWHGIDRLIEGLSEYCQNSTDPASLHLHLAGDGPAVSTLRTLAKQRGVCEHVIFHGMLDQNGLSALYDTCSLAVETLGFHRTGISLSSSLKSREYLAKGMPFIYSTPIDVLQANPAGFCLKVPADETPIDIPELIRFHNALYGQNSEQSIINAIRSYAESNISSDRTMEGIIDYISKTHHLEHRTEKSSETHPLVR